jgi:hypothetical protein
MYFAFVLHVEFGCLFVYRWLYMKDNTYEESFIIMLWM